MSLSTSLAQHHAGGGTALGVAGGQHHGVGIGLVLATDGFGKPFGHQGQRVGGQGIGQGLIGYHLQSLPVPASGKPMTLEELRQQLNQLDGELLALIAKRQAISREVAAAKRATGHPTRDYKREREVILGVRARPKASGCRLIWPNR